MATYAEQSDAVLESLEDRGSKADLMLSQTVSLITQTRLAITEAIESLVALQLPAPDAPSVTLDGLSVVGSMEAPQVPTIVSAPVSFIPESMAAWLAAREMSDAYSAGLGEELAAQEEAALRGVAVPPVVAYGMATEARKRTMSVAAKASESASASYYKSAVESQFKALEHSQQIFATHAKLLNDNNNVIIESAKAALEQQKVYADVTIKTTELAGTNSVQQLIELTQVYAQLCNALYSASDVSLSSGASIGVGYPFKYNPNAGEVVINAA